MSWGKRGIFLTLEIEEFAGFLNLIFEFIPRCPEVSGSSRCFHKQQGIQI